MIQIAIGISLVILATILHGSKSVEAFQIRTSKPVKKPVVAKKSIPAKKAPLKTNKAVLKRSVTAASPTAYAVPAATQPVAQVPAATQPVAQVPAATQPVAEVPDYDKYKTYNDGDVIRYKGNSFKLTNTIGAAGYAPDYPGNPNVQEGAGWVLAPASVLIQGFQSYHNPYNSSPAVQQSLEFRLGQTSYSKQVQTGWLM